MEVAFDECTEQSFSKFNNLFFHRGITTWCKGVRSDVMDKVMTATHMHYYYSVMIHRVSMSEQQTDLPICHCTKQDLSCIGRYLDKSSPEIDRNHIRQQPGQLLSVWLHKHGLSFTLKS